MFVLVFLTIVVGVLESGVSKEVVMANRFE